MNEAKKMIVGNTEKARKEAVPATCPGIGVKTPLPGSPVPMGMLLSTRLPKMKRAPSTAYPSSPTTTVLAPSKSASPTGVLRMKNAKSN